MTKHITLALAKKNPAEFLLKYATVIAKENVESYITANDVSADEADQLRDELFVDYNGGHLNYIDNECMDRIVDGLTLREAHAKGGGEGGGEQVVRVWAVMTGCVLKKPSPTEKKHGINPGTKGGEDVLYLRATGYYASYQGTEFNEDIEIVEPYEVLTKVYLTKKERKKVT